MKLYVGNLPDSFQEEDLRNLFVDFGTVKSAMLIIDRTTGKSRGFGFVEMSSKGEGLNAIKELNKKTVDDRSIIVNEARPQEKRTDRGGDRGDSPFKKRFR